MELCGGIKTKTKPSKPISYHWQIKPSANIRNILNAFCTRRLCESYRSQTELPIMPANMPSNPLSIRYKADPWLFGRPYGLVAWFFLWVFNMEEVLGSIPSEALFFSNHAKFYFLLFFIMINKMIPIITETYSIYQFRNSMFQRIANQKKACRWFNPGSNWRPSVYTMWDRNHNH